MIDVTALDHSSSSWQLLNIIAAVPESRNDSRPLFPFPVPFSPFFVPGPEQALRFAKIQQRQYQKKKNPSAEDQLRASEPLAVVASMIRLGFCFDLLDLEYAQAVYEEFRQRMRGANARLPTNKRKHRKLDCAIFQFAYEVLKKEGSPVVTARGVYVPTDGEKRAWDDSWIRKDI